MENFGLGYVLNHWGLTGAILISILWGLAIGTISQFYLKKATTSKREVWLAIFISALFFVGWMIMTGISLFSGTHIIIEIIVSIVFLFLFFVFVAVSMFDKSTSIASRNFTARLVSITVMSVLVFLFFIICEDELSMIKFDNEQRANYYGTTILMNPSHTDSSTVTDTLVKINKFHSKDEALYWGMGYLKLNEPVKAKDQFYLYGARRGGNEKIAWEGIGDYYAGNFYKAALKFELSNDPDLEIIALDKGRFLTLNDFNRLKNKKRWLPDQYLASVESGLAPKNVAIVVEKKNEISTLDLLVQKVEKLEKIIAKQTDEPVKAQPELPAYDVDAGVFTYLTNARPQFPANKFVKSAKLEYFTFLFIDELLIIVFLISFFTSNMIARDHWKQIRGSRILTKIGNLLSSLLRHISFHSLPARQLAARIALLEKKKGMFSEEVEKIRTECFPLDVVFGLFYWTRAKRTVKKFDISSQEKEDIKIIYGEIKKLCGGLIPQGDEDSLAIISAIRKKAVKNIRDYLKDKTGYLKTRTLLMESLEELETVGDVLDAKAGRGDVSYYNLLGLSPQADSETIKKAYRTVIGVIHPDRNNGDYHLQSLAAVVNAAYSTLGNPISKNIYDRQKRA
jgi:hypothetical protein